MTAEYNTELTDGEVVKMIESAVDFAFDGSIPNDDSTNLEWVCALALRAAKSGINSGTFNGTTFLDELLCDV